MLKIGIFGAGHLGKIHLKIAENSNIFELVGFHDSDFNVVNKLLKEFDYKFFEISKFKNIIKPKRLLLLNILRQF